MRINRLHARIALTAIILAAFATRLWHVFQPNAVVFDEVYFKVYAGNYLNGAYYFDPHPPLGKLLLGGWAWLTHLDGAALVATDQASVALRLLPALAGSLIIPVFYLFMRLLKANRPTALLGALLLVVENALIVESRFILIDSLLILFGLSAITIYLYARRQPAGHTRITFILAAGLLAGLAASVKWTGLSALGLIGLIWLTDQLRFRRHRRPIWQLIEGATLILAPLVIYTGTFFVHFALLTKTGQGDAFMSQKFQSTLHDSPYYDPQAKMNFAEKFFELNIEMVRSEDSLKTATHPYGSTWLSWPFMIRDVYYWQGQAEPNGTQGHIYLLGNPVIWWGIIFIIPASLVALAGHYHRTMQPYAFPLTVTLVGYMSNFLPFAHIVRVMFLYHYFFALIFSLAGALLLLQIVIGHIAAARTTAGYRQLQWWTYGGIALAATITFVYFAPLTYGLPLTNDQLQHHMWLKTWR